MSHSPEVERGAAEQARFPEEIGAVTSFWQDVRCHIPGIPSRPDGIWPFGATPNQADSLLALVLAGVKTATASPYQDYDKDTMVPKAGEVSVILDGQGTPRAIIRTTRVDVCPFLSVTAEHAYAEGEGERTLSDWRKTHERYWREHSSFAEDMLIVCEKFELLYPKRPVSPAFPPKDGVPAE